MLTTQPRYQLLILKGQTAKCANMIALKVKIVNPTQPANDLQLRPELLIEIQVILLVERKERGQHVEGVHECRQGRGDNKDAHQHVEVEGIFALAASVLFRVEENVTVEQPAHKDAVEEYDPEHGTFSTVFNPELIECFYCVNCGITVEPFLDGYPTVRG